MAEQEKIIQVIRKLLALASNNPSQEEAISASLKAQELMAKYHIDERNLMDKIEDTIEESTYVFNESDPNNHKWKYTLSAIVSKNFRCEVYYAGKHMVRFYGYKQDTEIAKEVFGSLYKIGDRLGSREFKKSVKDTGTGKGVYNSFIAGFLKGIREALEAQCTALMIVTPKEVKDGFIDLTKSMGNVKGTALGFNNGFSSKHFEKGVQEGRNAISSRTIESKK